MNSEAMKKASRGISRDMSPEAIARRIQIVSELRALTMQLGTARRIGPTDDGRPADPHKTSPPVPPRKA